MLPGAGRPEAGKMKEEDKKFKDYVKRMVAKEGFRPAEGSEHRWHVDSEHSDEVYDTTVSEKSVFCSCREHEVALGNECKHIRLIRLISRIFGFASTKKTVIEEPDGNRCFHCGESDFHEHSVRETTRKGDVQRYECNVCKRNFTLVKEFGPTWYSPQTIMESLSMYYRGMSTREVRDHWRDTRGSEDEKYPSHAIISKWAKQYPIMISKYIAKFTPDVSDIWSTDELYILVDKVMRYLYVFACHETRWILSADLEETKLTADITPIAEEAKKAAGKVSEIELRDGAANLNSAIKTAHKETEGGREKATQQVYAHIKGNPTNRRHERLNRTLSERLRVPRFIKKLDSKLVAGFVTFYNCIRRHIGLGGCTPATAAGIIIKGANPWSTLIRNAYWCAR